MIEAAKEAPNVTLWLIAMGLWAILAIVQLWTALAVQRIKTWMLQTQLQQDRDYRAEFVTHDTCNALRRPQIAGRQQRTTRKCLTD